MASRPRVPITINCAFSASATLIMLWPALLHDDSQRTLCFICHSHTHAHMLSRYEPAASIKLLNVYSRWFVNTTKARFPFKRNRLRWQAANHGCHCFERAFLLAAALAFVAWNFHATNARSSGNHDWLLANASACVSCSFRLRNARNAIKRLRLNGNGLYRIWSKSTTYSMFWHQRRHSVSLKVKAEILK